MTRQKKDAATLRFRVDTFCLKRGWLHAASFLTETDAYDYAEKQTVRGVRMRVWWGDECVITADPHSWHAPPHLRNCDGKPCECGAVPPLGSMHRGR